MRKWGVGLLVALSLLALTVQCSSSAVPPVDNTPSLPAPPGGPALRIALLSPTTGELATFGRMLRNGSLMAFEAWNAQNGGVLGHRLEGVEYDATCDYELARQTSQQAIAAGFHFIIGPLCSEAAIAAAQVAEADLALMLAPTATHPLVTVNGEGLTRPTVFRASFAWPWQGQAAARFAYDQLRASKAALFFDPSDDYSQILVDSFAQRFESLGGEIVYRAAYSPTDTDFKPALQASHEAGAELIYLPAPASIVNRVAGQRRELGWSNSIALLGSDSWESVELDRAAAEGSYFTMHFLLEDQRPATREWADAYKAIYAVEPTTLAVLGYEAASILASGIEQAGTFEVKTVAETIEQGRFDGVTGPIHFDDQHNPLKPVPVAQIKNGQIIFSSMISP
jgi:branched-chain amino acid transport system substrate-binding protein